MSVRKYTENRTAAVLGVPRPTLAMRRVKGMVRADVFVDVDQPRSKFQRIFYNADMVDEIAAGDDSLYVKTTPA